MTPEVAVIYVYCLTSLYLFAVMTVIKYELDKRMSLVVALACICIYVYVTIRILNLWSKVIDSKPIVTDWSVAIIMYLTIRL